MNESTGAFLLRIIVTLLVIIVFHYLFHYLGNAL